MNRTKIEWTDCACGCGIRISVRDKWGRIHKFISGHNSFGNKNSLGKKHTVEWKKEASERNKGQGNSQFKTGRPLSDNGYILSLSPNHPHKKHRNYVYEHRLVMEQKLGRYLNPEEVVHHVNGIKTDNRVENLMLFANDSEHKKFEAKHSE